MNRSLRARLLVMLLGTVLVAWLATALFSFLDARHEIGELLDAHLAQSAELLVAQMEHELEEMDGRGLTREHRHSRKLVYQIWDREGKLRIRSENAPDRPLSAAENGFDDVTFHRHRWRVYSVWNEDRNYKVQVGERFELRDELSETIAGHLMHPLVVALPVIALLIWLSVGRGLLPLKGLARQVGERAPDNLAPLDTARAPREVLPLASALNSLFVRLHNSLEKERRFTADAAHELRTPLAAVKTQAQVAQGARGPEERARALAQVVAGVDRAAHLVEQLLVLARLDPASPGKRREPVRLAEIAADCLVQEAAMAADKNIEIGLEGDDSAITSGDPSLLAILVRNLVDNAIRYTPAGGAVTVRTEKRPGGSALVVSDTGPGIPAAEREQVFRRFYRVLGTGEEGSGLGLSIVRRIADLHGATLALRDGEAGQGLVVEVVFPAAGPHGPVAGATLLSEENAATRDAVE